MRVVRVALVVVTFTSLVAIANARVRDDAETSPNAFAAQRTPLARPALRVKHGVEILVPTATGHEHVVLPPVIVAPPDRNDPWTGAPITARTYYAPLDTTDPWTGERLSVQPRPVVDADDPWR